MTEQLVRATTNIVLEDDCSNTWRFEDGGGLPYYVCQKHRQAVPLGGYCSASRTQIKAGETVLVPSKVARHLIESEQAVYPTHEPEIDQGVKATIDRVNALMEQEGLPFCDAESLGLLKVEGRRNHYGRPASRPRDNRLASDLGLDPSDIADMRKLSKGDN